MAKTEPRKVLYCESNVDGTIGGSHYCLLWLVENLDRSAYTPLVVFHEDHALVPRFQAVAETIVLPRARPVSWGSEAGSPGLLRLPAVAARRVINVITFFGRVLSYVTFLRNHQIALLHQNNSIRRHHDWMLAAAIAGVPCIAHERGINERFSWIDRTMARRLRLIIPMSKAIEGYMVSGGVSPSNIRVLYDGLDPDSVRPQRTPDELRRLFQVGPDQPVIGIVGNIRIWKGQEVVVRALSEVVKTVPDVVCFFVGAATSGDAPYQARLNALIDEAGIRDNVRFTGYQPDPASFVNLMSIVIHASIEPEPFGMVVLEAMAQRKPVLGSRAGGVVEMVVDGETGYTFAPGDSAELTRRLTELLRDPVQARRMGEAGYARLVESFSTKEYMRNIHAVYQSVVG